MRKELDPGYYQPVHDWSAPVTTSTRLSIFLVLVVLLVLPLPTPEKSQLLWLAAQQSAFVFFVVVVQQYTPKIIAETRSLLVSISMVVFVLSVAITMRAEAASLLLFVPVINAALRASGRGLIAITILASSGWVYIHTMSGTPEPWSWTSALVGVAPLVLVAYILHVLRNATNLVQNRLTTLSHQDELSGALNMRAFTRLLMAAHSHAGYEESGYALLMVDIKNLQNINEKYGHDQGNKTIVATADALKRSIRSNDILARYGGDEFIVYLAGADDEIAQAVSNRIGQNVYNITMSFDRGTEKVEVHTGIALYPDHGATMQDMMGFADKAMYQEKEFREKARTPASSSNIGREQAGLERR